MNIYWEKALDGLILFQKSKVANKDLKIMKNEFDKNVSDKNDQAESKIVNSKIFFRLKKINLYLQVTHLREKRILDSTFRLSL